MSTHRRPHRISHRSPRLGAVLIEFAFVAVAFYLLFAGTITMGTMISTAQAVQNAARVGARELALVALPPTMNFRQALHDPEVKARVYDPNLLAVPVGSGIPDTSGWPIINRMLTPLMIYDTINGVDFYHYPGAVVHSDSGYSVKVPVVSGRDPTTGVETVSFHDVVEEVLDSNGNGPFSLSAAAGDPLFPERGLVALRINCPYQSASMSAFQVAPGAHTPIYANDSAVQIHSYPGAPVPDTGLEFVGQTNPGTQTDADGNNPDYGPYAGKYGLGRMYAMDGVLRPFRRMISAQSLFRREVYR